MKPTKMDALTVNFFHKRPEQIHFDSRLVLRKTYQSTVKKKPKTNNKNELISMCTRTLVEC